MYADIIGTKIINIWRGSNFPKKVARDRWVRVIEEGGGYDLITEQRLGPEQVVESDRVRLVYTVVAHPDAVPRLAADLKRRAGVIFDTETAKVTAGYTDKSIASWDQQNAEAQGFATGAPTPLLSALAETRGIPLELLVERVLANAAGFAVATGRLLGREQRIGDLIDAAETLDELRRIEAEELNNGW